MLFARLKSRKGQKGVTLVEMVVAIAVMAILATVLSMMLSPVISLFQTNKEKVDLIEAGTALLNDLAKQLRKATEIYVAEEGSFSEITRIDSSYGELLTDKFTFAVGSSPKYIMTLNQQGRNEEGEASYYPCIKVVDPDNKTRNNKIRVTAYEDYVGRTLDSDDYLDPEIECRKLSTSHEFDDYTKTDYNNDFYFLVRSNPNSINPTTESELGNIIEIHLRLWKTNKEVYYEASKTIVCENLVVKKAAIQMIDSDERVIKANENEILSFGADPDNWKVFRSVWYWYSEESLY